MSGQPDWNDAIRYIAHAQRALADLTDIVAAGSSAVTRPISEVTAAMEQLQAAARAEFDRRVYAEQAARVECRARASEAVAR